MVASSFCSGVTCEPTCWCRGLSFVFTGGPVWVDCRESTWLCRYECVTLCECRECNSLLVLRLMGLSSLKLLVGLFLLPTYRRLAAWSRGRHAWTDVAVGDTGFNLSCIGWCGRLFCFAKRQNLKSKNMSVCFQKRQNCQAAKKAIKNMSWSVLTCLFWRMY